MKNNELTGKLSLRKENITSFKRNVNTKGTGTYCWMAASLGGIGVTCLFTMIQTCTCYTSGYDYCEQ